jgi:DNA-binding helix-hairpin-helix protein with protein kinase domain
MALSESESLTLLLAGIKANPRLRLGLWFIVGIAWLYGLLLLRDATIRAATEYQVLAKKVARVEALSGQNEWIARVEPAQSQQLYLESRLWRESTIGLAQAAFQDWLNQAVQQANLTHSVVTVAAQEESSSEKAAPNVTEAAPNSDLWKVSAKLSFDFTPKSLYALMGYLSEHDKQTVVETLVIRGAPASRVEMMLVAHFQKPAAQQSAVGTNKDSVHVRP